MQNTPGLAVRFQAAKSLQAICAQGQLLNAETAPEQLQKRGLYDRDAALFRQLVTIALRHHGQIGAILDDLMQKGVPKKSGLLDPILRIAIAQILFMDIADHSAVHLAVESARLEKKAARFDKLVNGVLRNTLRQREKFAALSPTLNLPKWLAERWTKQFGPETLENIATCLASTPPLDISLSNDIDKWATALEAKILPTGNSIRIDKLASRVSELPGFDEGAWWVQDLAASLPAKLINAENGATVADLCAAPGGKTAQLAARGFRVTALDLSAKRLERVAENLARLNLKAALVDSDLLAYTPGDPFDAILLDAPCSATGTLRRHPDIAIHRTLDDIQNRATLQANLLAHAATLLKPGGTLVYAVCSLEPEEGPQIIDNFLHQNENFARDPITADDLNGWDTSLTPPGDILTIPGTELADIAGSLDGFFIARLKKHLA